MLLLHICTYVYSVIHLEVRWPSAVSLPPYISVNLFAPEVINSAQFYYE